MSEPRWRCHTPNLLGEILNNEQCAILSIPLNIFARLLMQVATRASQLNDPELNALMCYLTLYEIADPDSPNYDKERLSQILKEGKSGSVTNPADNVDIHHICPDDL